MRIAILGLAACVGAVACAPAGTTTADPSAPRTQTIRADGIGGSLRISQNTDASATRMPRPADDVYRVMHLVYDSLAIPKTWLDPKQLLISSQGFKIRARMGKTMLSKFIDCGRTQIGPNADSYDVFMTVTTKVTPNGTTESTLGTTVEADARPLSFNQDYARCTSTGQLERRIADAALSFLNQ
jgi:hypothetical protein